MSVLTRSLMALAMGGILAAGCATTAPVAASRAPSSVELTLHDVTPAEAESYAATLRQSGDYGSVEVKVQPDRTARIVARTASQATTR